ncbi:hypothetical protein EV141_0572 [Microcella putealis]|uniref:Uncharacterized protein n=1 Tax=Microcella putealis TaxID=337005 RepID=A0A4Q7LXD8_9MICO|nr:hypothetical protein [Microcella putealis]RZS59351.1 hypothetical protein EV141_0572 [Microcella putealis]TQM19976.1 hypothetical protein BJ957_2109 [Microcella putealis]
MSPHIITAARRGAIYGIIISFSAAALVGIVALLGGDFGETQGRVVLTTVLVGAFSITALCHLAVADRAMRVVAAVGLLASAAGLVFGLVLIWRDWDAPGFDDWLRAFATAGILAVSVAHANLLLLLAGRRRRVIRVGLALTLVAIAVVAVMLILPILTDGDIPGPDAELYWRVAGVVGILDALGTVVVPVLAIFLRDGADAASAGTETVVGGQTSSGDALTVTVPASLADELRRRAADDGVPVEVSIIEALRRSLR